MSTFAADCKKCFDSLDLYVVLKITTTNKDNVTSDAIKKAYYKQSMLWHPDRFAGEEDQEKVADAKLRFQVLSKAYSILSDSEKREIYDNTGIVDDELLDTEETDWLSLWKGMFKPVTKKAVDDYMGNYIGSKTEIADIQKAYVKYKGNMKDITDAVITGDNEDRVRSIINDLIEQEKVEAYPKFINDSNAARARRAKKRAEEAKESEKYAEELRKKSGKSKANFNLMNVLEENQRKRMKEAASMLSRLEQKYCKPKRKAVDNGPSSSKKGKK